MSAVVTGIKDLSGADVEDQRKVMDSIVASLSSDAVRRQMFDDLDQSADKHGPLTRQLYLALYRRLHG